MDGQGSLSHLLPPPGTRPPARPPDDTAFLSAFFAHKTKLSELVRPTRFDNVWIIPADRDLFLLDRGAAGHPSDELTFVRAVHTSGLVAPDGQPFDWVILDTPPAQSFFTRAALAAAHYVLLPVYADALAVYGTDGALHTAATMRGLMGSGVQLIGGVPTRWKRTPEADKALVALADHLRSYGTRLLPIAIPDDGKVDKTIAKSEAGGISGIFQIGSTPGPAADAYRKLVKESLPHVNSHQGTAHADATPR
jgi:cellulose biosynthesis protein BcsQ